LQIYNGRSTFYQWDLYQKLIIDDVKHDYVHFANEGDSTALVVKVYERDGIRLADVPNILLQSGKRIIAYSCLSADDDFHTHYLTKFKVKSRPKPADYVYTETEVFSCNSKLDKNLGAENAGKALIVDDNGDIRPESVSFSQDGIQQMIDESISHIARFEDGYEVTPKVTAQTLSTKGKLMSNDLEIKQIPTYEVSNQTGTTFYIGE